jgi:hypothetical protein
MDINLLVSLWVGSTNRLIKGIAVHPENEVINILRRCYETENKDVLLHSDSWVESEEACRNGLGIVGGIPRRIRKFTLCVDRDFG